MSDPRVRGDGFRADAFDAVVDEQLGIGQACQVAAHEARELGLISRMRGISPAGSCCAGIWSSGSTNLPGRNVLCYGVFEDVLARSEHQRADQLPGMGGDPRQTPQAGAAQQVDEEGFDRVVDVVGDGYHRVTVLAAQFVEPGVAQPPFPEASPAGSSLAFRVTSRTRILDALL